MNRLSTEKRGQILAMLTEGNSLRATSRLAGVSINTVSKLLGDVGAACTEYQDRVLRDLPCKVIEADEIWSYCYAKQKNVPEEFKGTPGYGDVWTFTAVCADTKLVPAWLVGERTADDAYVFLCDLRDRLANRIQLSTDGHSMYESTVGVAFRHQVDWIQKVYRSDSPQRKYSPASCVGTKVRVLKGDPVSRPVENWATSAG